MSSKTDDLVEYHVYQLGELLVEAANCDVWTLIVLSTNGEYVPRQHGALTAYQLRDDGLWDSVYHCLSPLSPEGEEWIFAHGDAVKIDPALMKSVADSRLYVQAEFRERQLDLQFLEIMADMDW